MLPAVSGSGGCQKQIRNNSRVHYEGKEPEAVIRLRRHILRRFSVQDPSRHSRG